MAACVMPRRGGATIELRRLEGLMRNRKRSNPTARVLPARLRLPGAPLGLGLAWVAVVIAVNFSCVAPALSGVGASGQRGDLPPIVFASRNPIVQTDGRVDLGAIPGIGPRDRTAPVGGRLLIRDPDGGVRSLIGEGQLFDVADPCVSWDGATVLFSGLVHPDSSWRIYSLGADGSGLTQVTYTDRAVSLEQFGAAAGRFSRYDDFDPCWLPDGRVCFASTRYPMIAQLGDHLSSNLFVADGPGIPPHRVTTDRNGAEEPTIDPSSGRVVYSRWLLNVDRPSNTTRDGITVLDHQALTNDVGNIWQTLSSTPDGRGARLHAGDPRSRRGLHTYKAAPISGERVLTLSGASSAFAPSPGATAVYLFDVGVGPGRFVAGWKPESMETAAAAAAVRRDAFSAPTEQFARPRPPFAVDPVELPDGRLLLSLVTSSDGDYGLYACSMDGSDLTRILDLPGVHDLDTQVLAPRPVPPVIADEVDPARTATLPPTEDPETFTSGGTFRLDCLNIFTNAPVDAPIPDAPPIRLGTHARLFMSFQRQSPYGRDPSILFRDAPLTARGAIAEQGIPADVPLFDQLTDAQGRVLVGPTGTPAHLAGMNFGRHGNWAQCVGCHAGHSVIEIASSFTEAEWFNAATSARVEASSVWSADGLTRSRFSGSRVVDRRARNDSLDVAWVADGGAGESVTLRWEVPIEVRRFVLYNIQSNREEMTDLSVEACAITLYRGDAIVGRVVATGLLDPGGTPVDVAPVIIDAAKIEINKATGHVRGEPRAGLAEVEAIARLADEALSLVR